MSVHQLPTVSLFIFRCQTWGCVGAGCALLKMTHWFPGNRQEKTVYLHFLFASSQPRGENSVCCSAAACLFVDVTLITFIFFSTKTLQKLETFNNAEQFFNLQSSKFTVSPPLTPQKRMQCCFVIDSTW